MKLSLVTLGLVLLLSVVDGDEQTEDNVLTPLYQLELYFETQVIKGLEKLEYRRFLIPKIVENIKNTLIAASVQKQALFRIVLNEYFTEHPPIYLIRGIVEGLYNTKIVEKAIVKIIGHEVDPELYYTYIEDTALDLEDIVDRFIKPLHPKDNKQ